MNVFEKLQQNPVMLYGAAGLLAGNLLGGSQKERTGQAVLYGALGAAVGWFVTKGREQASSAEVSEAEAMNEAQIADKAAMVANALNGWGGPAGSRPQRGTRQYRHARRRLLENMGPQTEACPVDMFAGVVGPGMF
tara:strand:+ start:286 stop:693 length:408 start_codon:yes stop_codon:yes gene_type:complete